MYAKWTPNKYTIKFNGNGATGGKVKNMTNSKYDTSYKLTANAFKRTGYTFNGWNTKADGNGTAYKNKADIKNLISANGKTITLYAQWNKDTYKITYKLNKGKNKKGNPSTYTVTGAITLKKPTRTGYTFAGWNTKKNGKGKAYKNKASVKNLVSTNGKTITLYAQWKKK